MLTSRDCDVTITPEQFEELAVCREFVDGPYVETNETRFYKSLWKFGELKDGRKVKAITW